MTPAPEKKPRGGPSRKERRAQLANLPKPTKAKVRKAKRQMEDIKKASSHRYSKTANKNFKKALKQRAQELVEQGVQDAREGRLGSGPPSAALAGLPPPPHGSIDEGEDHDVSVPGSGQLEEPHESAADAGLAGHGSREAVCPTVLRVGERGSAQPPPPAERGD